MTEARQESNLSSHAETHALAVNTLRFLAVDAVEAANSGHPGLPLGAAPMAYALFAGHLKFHPGQPGWAGRDRFILSAGHGSALQYALLHIFGYDLPLDEVKRFRQLGSLTPGHPEVKLTPGVECTTGPLGAGLGNAVGMALAESWMAARYNQGGANVVDWNTYVLVSDGDLMEGIGQEAASLAGHLRLGKLIALYDSNDISLDGPCRNAFTEDTRAKFEAMGWHTQVVADGNNLEAIDGAIREARAVTDRPSLIEVRTIIGFGSPKAGSSAAHGAPLGAEGTSATKIALDWPESPAFYVPDTVKGIAAQAHAVGAANVAAHAQEVDKLRAHDAALADEYAALIAGQLPAGWDASIAALTPGAGKSATRDAGKAALNAVAKGIPFLVGGAADLASSTKTSVDGSGIFSTEDRTGRNVWFGVREHAMGAMANGMALAGLRPFVSTFLVFSDYMRTPMRLAALNQLPAIFVFTHDSVFVGEDGPTHQPIEHVESLRLIPGLDVYRPADAYETAHCWHQAVASGKPAVLVLTRQALPHLEAYADKMAAGVAQGGYVLSDAAGAQATLVASGSEVDLALKAQAALAGEGVAVRVVSVPCRDRWATLTRAERETMLTGPVIALEAGVTTGWRGYADEVIGIDRFGESAPGDTVYAHLGMTVDRVSATVKAHLG